MHEQVNPPVSSRRVFAVAALAVVMLATLLCFPPIPQDPAYHDFANQSALWGIPCFGDVITNLVFVLAGLHGLVVLMGMRRATGSSPFREKGEKPAYFLFFMGLVLTGLGSAYYHLDPTTERLFWDRLPMTVAFMPFFCIILSERISLKWGKRFLIPFLLLGAASVIYWHLGEARGQGDLRFYIFVQFFPILAIPMILLLFPPRYSHGGYFWWVLAGYGAAKVFEFLDRELLSLFVGVSGHNLKHVLAGLGSWCVVFMLIGRKPLEGDGVEARRED